MLCLSGCLELCLCCGSLLSGSGGRVGDTTNDVGHGTASIGAENFHGDEVGTLGNTESGTSNGTSAVRAVTVAVLIDVVRDGLAPGGTTLEVDVLDIDAGINDVHVDTLASLSRVEILGECAKGEFSAVSDTSETLQKSGQKDTSRTTGE